MADPLITIGGLALHGVDAHGVQWVVPKNGLDWSGAAGSTLTLLQRARGHGAVAGEAFHKSRSYSLTGHLEGPSRSAVEGALDRLAAAASIDDTELVVIEESLTRRATVRRDDEIVVAWTNGRAARFSTGLTNPDGRRFSADLTASTPLPSSSGGLTIPFTIPFSIDAVTVTGQVSLTNPGNVAGPVRLRIDGPVTGPVVTHVSSGKALVFASSLVLGVGEFVTVDMERREVLAQGQASRSGWVTRREWSAFEPGENSWAFTAVGADPGALLTVTATPAWM